MPYDYSAIITAQAQRLDSEASQAAADLEAARHRDDVDGVMWAAGRILELDAQRNALDARARQYMAQQARQPQGHQYGLSDEEIEIAKNSFSGVTPEEKIVSYVRNKQRLQHMRATGEYREDQGSIRR